MRFVRLAVMGAVAVAICGTAYVYRDEVAQRLGLGNAASAAEKAAQASVEQAVENYLDNVFHAFHAMHDPSTLSADTPKMNLESFSQARA